MTGMTDKNDPTVLSEELEQQLKQRLYQEIFKQSHFARLDGLNEYDEDFSGFTPLGDLIPAEMQAALIRLEQADAPDQETTNEETATKNV